MEKPPVDCWYSTANCVTVLSEVQVCVLVGVCVCILYVNKPMGSLVERCYINQIGNNK